MYFVLQGPWVRMRYSMKQKAFHILPTLTFITVNKRARFKSQEQKKMFVYHIFLLTI